MTFEDIRQENKELRSRITQLEDLLKKALGGPFKVGEIKSEMFGGLIRLADGSIKAINPEKETELKKAKIGTAVLTNNTMILGVLPDELVIKPEPVKFNFIEWNSIAGLNNQISEIREAIILPMKHPDVYKKYGITPSKGIVLYGPPGCGKTLVARAAASEFLKEKEITPDSFIYLKGGEMLSPYVGVAENNIKSIFERARNNFKKTGNRSVIFIDEAEAILPARGSRRSSDVETTIVPTFLSEMDGFEEGGPLVILATNYVEQLDSAVVRPGRVDNHVEVPRPDTQGMRDIFELYFKSARLAEPIESLVTNGTACLAEKNNYFHSGAYISDIVNKAKMVALKRELSGKSKVSGITSEDIINIINTITE